MSGGVESQRWMSIESRRVLSSSDQELVSEARQLLAELKRVVPVLPGALVLIRDNMSGQPRSGLAGGDGDPSPWCWVHEREVSRCHADPALEGEVLCEGEILTGPSDPTGNAGVVPDRAARDLQEVTARLRTMVNAGRDLTATLAGYPAAPLRDEDEPETPGEDLCRCCWKADKYPKLIEKRPDTGKAYYRGLCRWCGQTRRALDDREPPTWLVAAHLRSEVITEGMITRARRELDALDSAKKKHRKKTRRRR